MGKKKKKKSKEGKSFFSKKRKRLLFRLTIIGLLAYAGYTLANPETIKDPKRRAQVESLQQTISETSNKAQEQVVDKLPQSQKLTGLASSLSKQGVVVGDQEIYVEDAIDQVGESLKDLPKSQVQRIKADFCADVIDIALREATASSSSN